MYLPLWLKKLLWGPAPTPAKNVERASEAALKTLETRCHKLPAILIVGIYDRGKIAFQCFSQPEIDSQGVNDLQTVLMTTTAHFLNHAPKRPHT